MGEIIGGVAGIAGSLIGGGARRRESRAAQAEFDQQKKSFSDFSFTNTYAGLENTAEDLTVNTQAAEFQAMNTDQALAASLDTMAQTGGGAGSAQAIANAALRSQQGISANIARQESQNQAMRAQQAAQLQADEAAGADRLQTRGFQKNQQMLNLAADRKAAADAAKQQATDQLIGGIGSVASGVIGGAAAGAFGNGKFSQFLGKFNKDK
jgi:hypothetical protein